MSIHLVQCPYTWYHVHTPGIMSTHLVDAVSLPERVFFRLPLLLDWAVRAPTPWDSIQANALGTFHCFGMGSVMFQKVHLGSKFSLYDVYVFEITSVRL